MPFVRGIGTPDDGVDRCIYIPNSQAYAYKLQGTYYGRDYAVGVVLATAGFSEVEANAYLDNLKDSYFKLVKS